MPHSNIITADSEQAIWAKIAEQLKAKKDDRDYTAEATIGKHCFTVDIDFHPESLEENPGGTTVFSCVLSADTDFRFRVTKQDFKSEIRKLFGMQDVIVGHQDLDRKFIIQSNYENLVKEILGIAEVSDYLLKLPVLIFEIIEFKIGANKEVVLTLEIEGKITDANALQELYVPFKAALDYLK